MRPRGAMIWNRRRPHGPPPGLHKFEPCGDRPAPGGVTGSGRPVRRRSDFSPPVRRRENVSLKTGRRRRPFAATDPPPVALTGPANVGPRRAPLRVRLLLRGRSPAPRDAPALSDDAERRRPCCRLTATFAGWRSAAPRRLRSKFVIRGGRGRGRGRGPRSALRGVEMRSAGPGPPRRPLRRPPTGSPRASPPDDPCGVFETPPLTAAREHTDTALSGTQSKEAAEKLVPTLTLCCRATSGIAAAADASETTRRYVRRRDGADAPEFPPRATRGTLGKYVRLVSDASRGCVTDG